MPLPKNKQSLPKKIRLSRKGIHVSRLFNFKDAYQYEHDHGGDGDYGGHEDRCTDASSPCMMSTVGSEVDQKSLNGNASSCLVL